MGKCTDIRDSFESVTDRFLTELGPIAAGQVAKDADMKYENLVKGLQHVQIYVGQGCSLALLYSNANVAVGLAS